LLKPTVEGIDRIDVEQEELVIPPRGGTRSHRDTLARLRPCYALRREFGGSAATVAVFGPAGSGTDP